MRMRHFFMRFLPCLLCLALALCGLWRFKLGQGGATALARAVQSGEILRLHILPDSDEPAAQADKLCVRDAVLEYLAPLLRKANSAAEAERIVSTHLAGVERIARQTLLQRGRALGVRARLATAAFPNRVYAGHLVPAGSYRALQVSLGSGRGHNWWCVLYPTLCFVGQDKVQLDEIRFESALVRWFRKLKKEKEGEKP